MLTLMLASICLAPVPKDIPAQEVTPGRYEVKWSDTDYVYWMEMDGTCISIPGGWTGMWKWDSKERELTITESNNAWSTNQSFTYKLDNVLRGKCVRMSINGVDYKHHHEFKVSFKK